MNQLELGEAAKVNGQNLVESHNADFVETMRERARELARCNGTVTSDDLHIYADEYGLKPKHPSAFGAIFATSEWKSVGFARSTRPVGHARTIRIWSLK